MADSAKTYLTSDFIIDNSCAEWILEKEFFEGVHEHVDFPEKAERVEYKGYWAEMQVYGDFTISNITIEMEDNKATTGVQWDRKWGVKGKLHRPARSYWLIKWDAKNYPFDSSLDIGFKPSVTWKLKSKEDDPLTIVLYLYVEKLDLGWPEAPEIFSGLLQRIFAILWHMAFPLNMVNDLVAWGVNAMLERVVKFDIDQISKYVNGYSDEDGVFHEGGISVGTDSEGTEQKLPISADFTKGPDFLHSAIRGKLRISAA